MRYVGDDGATTPTTSGIPDVVAAFDDVASVVALGARHLPRSAGPYSTASGRKAP